MISPLDHSTVEECGRKQPEHGSDHYIVFNSAEWLCGTDLWSACSAGLVLYNVCPFRYIFYRFDQCYLLSDDPTLLPLDNSELAVT